MPEPLLSIIMVSYHSQSDLARCLPTIYAQTVPSPEIIVVDNAPGDGTADWLAINHPSVRVITNPANTGYAGGNNLGIDQAKGEWVLILNPDTELHPGSLASLLATAEAHPNALITPKLLNPDGTINACGLDMHYTGITTCRGLNEAADSYQGLHDVLLISGAAFIARRDILKKLSGFDTSYFMYLEDVDLSLRARLHGYDILCAADVTITHYYTLGMTPKKYYYLERNRLLNVLTNYQKTTLCRLSPALLLTELATWGFGLLKGYAYLLVKLRGYQWLWQHRKQWQTTRKHLQDKRLVDDIQFLTNTQTLLPYDQLVSNKSAARLLETCTAPLFRLLKIRPYHQHEITLP
jgi:GT2 family glycosyltransferase